MPAKLKFSELSDRVKVLVVIGLTALFLIYFYNFLYMPAVDSAAQRDKQYQSLLLEVKSLDDFLKAHPDLDTYMLQTDRVMHTFNTLLPHDNNISSFIVILSKIAQAANVNITAIAPGQWQDKDRYQEIAMNVSINGSYLNTLHFIKLIEDNPMRFTSIKSLGIGMSEHAAEVGQLNSVMTLVVYNWKENDLEVRSNKIAGK